MKKLYLFITTLMCVVGVTSVNAEDRVLKLSTDPASEATSTNSIGGVIPNEAKILASFAGDNPYLPAGKSMLVGTEDTWDILASQDPNNPDITNLSETGFTFNSRGGRGGEYVAQMYDITDDAVFLNLSFKVLLNNSVNFSVWKITGTPATAKMLTSKSTGTWTLGETYSFVVEDETFTSGDKLVLVWGNTAAGGSTKITISEFSGKLSSGVDYAAKLEALLSTAQGVLADFGEEVGAYPMADAVDLTSAIAVAQAALNDGTVAEADVTTLQTAIDDIDFSTLTRNMPEPGKFYQLATWKTVNAGKVAFAKTDNKCYWGMNDTPAAVWVFEAAADGEYYLKNLSTGCYMNNYTGNAGGGADPNVLVESKQSVAVVASNNGRKVGVKVGNNYYLDRDQSNADANGCKPVCRWSDNAIPTGENRMWLINEVNPSDIKHTLSVGASGWATLILGFNAAIPTTEGVTVYAVESTTTTSATLKPVAGVLPANTAVLVNAPANSTVEFAYTEETASVSSLLEGTLYDKNITPEAGYTCYVLSMQNNAVGFYKATLNQESNAAFKNNANKVYLPVETANGAPSLSFVFDTETGIEGVGAAEAGKSAIHDLSGRRVKSAQKGIYIINGKKVVK